MHKNDLYPDINDDRKLYYKYLNKKNNAKKEGLKCELEYDEFVNLVREAGLVSSDLGFSGNNYVLARYNDEGNYTVDNCRFIKHSENITERHISEKSILASKRNAENLVRTMSILRKENPDKVNEAIKVGIKNSEKYKKIVEENRRKYEQKRSQMNSSYMGEKNSQYGTFWITDGVNNKKWRAEYGELPENFHRGRAI